MFLSIAIKTIIIIISDILICYAILCLRTVIKLSNKERLRYGVQENYSIQWQNFSPGIFRTSKREQKFT